MPLNCPQAVSKLKAYQQQHQKLQNQFDEFLSQVPFLPDIKWDEPFMSSPYYKDITKASKAIFDNLYNAKEEARVKLEELKELSNYVDLKEFVVKNALNPYTEALKEGGITDSELIVERKDIKINLQELLTQDKDAYRQAQLTEWVDALPDNIRDFKLTKQQLENLKSRIEQGEIPIFMPGRLAQLKGLMGSITRLKPIFIKDGEKQEVQETYLKDNRILNLITLMITEAKNMTYEVPDPTVRGIVEENLKAICKEKNALDLLESAVRSIPEKPYILTTKPDHSIDIRTRAKDLSEQRNVLATIKKLNSGVNIDCMSVGEYISLQNRFTSRLENESNNVLQELSPLDNYGQSQGTAFRLINLPLFSDGSTNMFFWNSLHFQISETMGGDFGEVDPAIGFRVAVRI